MVALTEMFITGYQTQDLVLKPAFVAEAMAAMADLATKITDGPALGIGGPCLKDGNLYNAWYVLQDGRIAATVLKHELPNNDVFDEKRVFAPAPPQGPYRIGPLRIGTPICEDAWHSDVCETLAETGAQILLVPNGSPYHRGKPAVRTNLMVARVVETGLPLVYLNMTGGQDDQVFDGASFVLNPGGELAGATAAVRCVHRPCRFSGNRRRLARLARALAPDAEILRGRLPRHGSVPSARTIWPRPALPKCCLACPAASISALGSRRLPPMPSAPKMSAA